MLRLESEDWTEFFIEELDYLMFDKSFIYFVD